MSEVLNRILGILLLPLLLFCSCTDEVIKENVLSYSISRAIDKDMNISGVKAYYYYHNERISVELDTTKEYVVLRDCAVVSRSINSNTYNNNLYNYIGNIVEKNYSNNLQSSNEKLEVIAIEDVTVNGTPLSPYIYVSLKTSSDITLLKELAAKIGWTIC